MFTSAGGVCATRCGRRLFWHLTDNRLQGQVACNARSTYTADLFPTQIRGTAVGASFTFGLGVAPLAPLIMGWIATASSIAAGLPLLALSFLLIAPLFVWFAPDTTRRELTDRAHVACQ
jgi:hypothetical protein